jgi:lysophospholipase L1-like esterase
MYDWADYAHYEKSNREITKAPKAVFMGNSITEGWAKRDPNFFASNNIVGRGISGQTSIQMLARFRADVIDLHPRYVVILAGTNDIARNTGYISLDNVFRNIASMCDIARKNPIKPDTLLRYAPPIIIVGYGPISNLPTRSSNSISAKGRMPTEKRSRMWTISPR